MSAMANEAMKEDRQMHDEHHSGPKKYLIIWAVLLALTGLTVWTGPMEIPGYWGLVLALVIASVKGTLVALYFMHLSEHQGANRLVFGVSIFFVALLLFFVMADVGTRFRPALPHNATPQAWPVDLDQNKVPDLSGRYGGMLKQSGTDSKP